MSARNLPDVMAKATLRDVGVAASYSSYARRHLSTMYVFDSTEYHRMSRKYFRLYRQFLPACRDATILDVGCGVGHFLQMLCDAGYTNCTGVDASSDAVEICRQNVCVRVFLGDAFAHLKEHVQSIDWIISMHLIEHLSLPDAARLTALLWKALRPRGTLVLATPNADSPWAGHCMFDDLTHQRLYTPRTLRQILEQGGFTGVDIYPETAVPYDLLTSARWALAKGLHLLRQVTYAIEIGPGRFRRNEIILTPGLIAVAKKQVTEAG